LGQFISVRFWVASSTIITAPQLTSRFTCTDNSYTWMFVPWPWLVPGLFSVGVNASAS
jgi:hypothetical protein